MNLTTFAAVRNPICAICAVVLPNANAGINTETAAVGVRLHGFSIITVNVTALHERSK